jgi:hypothetical protein
MTSKIKVDNINKVSDDSNIINKCGTTITLGASGDSIALASGASQTGFGRTGTVDWVTTKKTANFTAVSGEGYFCDTAASGAFTLTLPSSPSAGDIVGFKDYNGNFANANLTIGRGGSPINGGAGTDVVISTKGASVFLVYVDATQGWLATQDDASTFTGASFITATGGTITTSGDCKIHTFTGPGTFTVCSASCSADNNLVSYMVIAGGGGGGAVVASNIGGGGGGAGGYREVKSPLTPYTASPLDGYGTPGNRITVSAQGYPIVVGGGGAGGTDGSSSGLPGANGSVSTFSTISSAGGGFGAGGNVPSPTPNRYGGSPGGSGGGSSYSPGVKGNGNTPPVTPPQGNNGGCASCSPYRGAAGGGGATAVGAENAGPGCTSNPNAYAGALGGAGATSSINGTPTARASGGSGGSYYPNGAAPGATPGGGGAGGPGSGGVGSAGTTNTGGGGGGGGSGNPGPGAVGSAGGSGIVIIRYKFQ